MPIWIVPLLAAPFIGSFLGVLIRRLPAGRPIAVSRSACESCGVVLGVRDLVPLLSYALQRARCRYCGARIAFEHCAVELAAFAVALCVVITQSDADHIWAGCVLGWDLLALGWIGWSHLGKPKALTIPLIILGLVATEIMDPDAVVRHILAAAIGYLSFRAIDRVRRSPPTRDAIGSGNAELFAAAGAWAGPLLLPVIALGGALIGFCMTFAHASRERMSRREACADFGPSVTRRLAPGVALATWIVWLLSA